MVRQGARYGRTARPRGDVGFGSWEARNPQSAMASLEGLFLVGLGWRRRKQLLSVVKNWRENPFVFFLLLFVAEFSIIFSAAITNFGLLARQRVMATPFLIMLLCLKHARGKERELEEPAYKSSLELPRALRASAPRA